MSKKPEIESVDDILKKMDVAIDKLGAVIDEEKPNLCFVPHDEFYPNCEDCGKPRKKGDHSICEDKPF